MIYLLFSVVSFSRSRSVVVYVDALCLFVTYSALVIYSALNFSRCFFSGLKNDYVTAMCCDFIVNG